MHATGEAPPEELDHVCRNRSCVNPFHLRPVTKQQNQANRGLGADNTSGFKGVHWDKTAHKWQARIKVEGRHMHLGYFDDIQMAAKAYDMAAQRYFGEYAKLNLD